MATPTYTYVKKWRKQTLQKLKAAFGAKCGICGYDACMQALDFHHISKSEKHFNLSSWKKVANFDALINEAKKCVLLCCRCHREVHAGITSLNVDVTRLNESLLPKSKPSENYNSCAVCGKLKSMRNKFCSQKCAVKRRPQKIQWEQIKIDELVQSEGSIEAVARKLGVSGNAVRKQIRKLRAVSPHPDKVLKG